MKNYSLLFILLLIPFLALAQAHESKAVPNEVKTLDATIQTLYSVISGEAGEKRDWDLFRSLFAPGAKLIPTRAPKEGPKSLAYWTPEDYIDKAGPYLEEKGFIEEEIHRVSQTFGSLVHVFSTYQSFASSADEDPFARGINSIQLLHDGQRWWIVNIYWNQENDDNPIPSAFLPE